MISPRKSHRNSYSSKVILIIIVITYIVLHSIAYLYSLFYISDQKRILEKKELYDGPLVLNDKYKNVIYGKKGVYSNVGILYPGSLIDKLSSKLTTKNDNGELPEISDKFYESLFNTTRSILSAQNDTNKDNRFVYFTLINNAYTDLTLNWLCNVDTFENVLNRTIIATSSAHTCSTIKRQYSKVHCIYLTLPSSYSSSLEWGNKQYINWLILRAKIMLRLIEESLPFVLFETDAIWFRNPLDLFMNATHIDDADIVVPIKGYTGRGQTLSFDPMLVYPTNGTLSLFQEINRQLSSNSSLYDQDILDDLCRTQYNGVVCRTFEWQEIADGKWFKQSEEERSRYNPYIVNNNYYVGVKNKMTRQAMNKMWLLTANKNLCSSMRRRRMFEYIRRIYN